MEHVSLLTLFIILIILVFVSGFFSGSETGMMAINRYRLRHMARKKHRFAMIVSRLLERPDRLLGVILIGNTFANILASALATIIAVRFYGEIGVLIATVILTLTILVFAEVTPKTLAAIYPRRIAFAAAIPLKILLILFYPLVWLVNSIANGLLQLFGIKLQKKAIDQFTSEELQSVLRESSGSISQSHQEMLLSIFQLENVTVNDIMVPRNEIIGIDLNDDWETIVSQLTTSQHTRLPIFRDDIDGVIGLVHLRNILNYLAHDNLSKDTLIELAEDMYFVPENIPLSAQLLNFRHAKRRSGLVVDEYGEILGLIAMEDILEEIVGEFTTDFAAVSKDVHPQPDGSFLVDGTATLRELNRSMGWAFSTEGPKTLSGVILEYLEMIPPPGTGLRVDGYPIEVIKVQDNLVKTARIYPKLKQHKKKRT